MGMDDQVMPHIDQANVACGFHGGDPLTIRKTLALAARHGVSVGAHPAYPDLVGFGRRSMNLSRDEIVAGVLYQVSALDGMARSAGVELAYVKPHGALYNDMMAKPEVREALLEAMQSYCRPLPLMLQATPDFEAHRKEAEDRDLSVVFEAFADRCYDEDGRLLARSKPGAVHTRDKMLAQVRQLKAEGTVTTAAGKTLAVQADTLCVHGDNLEGVQAIAAIRELVDAH
jgi:5-oxoprolinase (ATP-hydrolysing) subunit A